MGGQGVVKLESEVRGIGQEEHYDQRREERENLNLKELGSGLGLGLLTGLEIDYLEVDSSDVQGGSN